MPMKETFARRIIRWQRRHGRHHLPWQGTRDPYRIWVAEIMLQQTQVATVIPYYQRFIARFPDVYALAAAEEEAVLAHWSGLGYYARGRNLHRAARVVVERYGGHFPSQPDALAALPGMGRSTAAAVAVFAYGVRAAILDGNVKRVLARHAGVDGWPGEKSVENRLWRIAEARLPSRNVEAYTQGLMDLGALLCTRRPDCGRCPVSADCVALAQGRVAELPTPRPARALPEREVAVLVLTDGNAVLLEKRPPTGVWGGLWSLPEGAPGEDAASAARRLGYGAGEWRELAPLTHTFTHFRLRLLPRVVRVSRNPGVCEPGRLWLPWTEVRRAALPSPVLRLLVAVSREEREGSASAGDEAGTKGTAKSAAGGAD
jgi:A/G-specific adenine glycosylase